MMTPTARPQPRPRISRFALGLLCAALECPLAGRASAQDDGVLVPEGEVPASLAMPFMDAAVPVNAIATSPDGGRIATGSDDGGVRLWDAFTGREVAVWKLPDPILSLAFSPDGRALACGSEHGVRVRDTATAEELVTVDTEGGTVRALAFDPDGRHLFWGTEEGEVRVHEWRAGAAPAAWSGHTDAVTAIAISPDGGAVASASRDGTIRLWDAKTGRCDRVLSAHKGWVMAVAFSRDGALLASGGYDRQLRIWDRRSGQMLECLAGHTDAISAIAFGVEGVVVSGSSDRTARIWSRASVGAPPLVLAHAGWVTAVSVSPDGLRVASGSHDTTSRVWDVATGGEILRLQGNSAGVASIAFATDGKVWATGGNDGFVRVWDADTGRMMRRIACGTGSVNALVFSPDGTLLSATSGAGEVQLFNAATGALVNRFSPHPLAILGMAFSPDGAVLATASVDKTIALSEPTTGRELKRLRGHQFAVDSVEFSPDGRLLASRSDDNTLRLWRLPEGTESDRAPLAQQRFEVRTDRGGRLAFSPDGKRIVLAVDQGGLLTLDVASGRTKALLRESAVSAVLFEPGGGGLVYAERTGALWLLPKEGAAPVLLDERHEPGTALAVSRGGLVARGFKTGEIRLANLRPRTPRAAAWTLIQGAGWLTVDPAGRWHRSDDGRFLQTIDARGFLRPIDPPAGRPGLTARVVRTESVELGGEPGRVTVRIENAREADRAFWIRVEPDVMPARVGLLPPAPVQRLDPGAAVEIDVRVAAIGTGEHDSGPWDDEVRFAIRCQGATAPTVSTSIHVRAPRIALQSAQAASLLGTEAVLLRFENTGDAPSGRLRLAAAFSNGATPFVNGASTVVESLEPGVSTSQVLTVPKAARGSGPLQLRALLTGARWPWQRWTLTTDRVSSAPNASAYLLGAGIAVLLVLIYLVRAYFNPTLRTIVATPDTLRRLPLRALPAVVCTLRRAGRLEPVLAAAGITPSNFERATRSAHGTAEEIARLFADALGGRLGARLGVDVWELKLPPLRLRFGPHTALAVFNGGRLEEGTARRAASEIDGDGSGPGTAIALDLTTAQDAARRLHCIQHIGFVVLGTDDLRDLHFAASPWKILERLIATQRPLVELSPYQTGGGVENDALFFGRVAEMRLLADRHPHSALVIAARQMGKSSLLKAVERRLHGREDVDARYVPLYGGDLVAQIAANLDLPPPTGANSFHAIAAGTRERPRLWLLDEVDAFIATDMAAGYPIARAMRALSEAGIAYFVLAGYREIFDVVTQQSRSPLRNLGELIRLGPLEPEAGRLLATQPLEALGLHFDLAETVTYLTEQTGCRANLIAIVCAELIGNLGPSQRVLSREDVDHAFFAPESHAVRDVLLQIWQHAALDRAVVAAAMRSEDVTDDALRERLKQAGLEPSMRELELSLERLSIAWVLQRDAARRIRCPVPLLRHYVLEVGADALLSESVRARAGATVAPG